MIEDTLFLSGSYESQRIACLDNRQLKLYPEIRKHFLYSCLLSRQVIQPIGHFYQSEIIRNITEEFCDLFVPNDINEGKPIACYSINMFKENFKEDADEKSKTYLGHKEFLCYHDEEYRKILTSKADVFVPYRRQGNQRDALAETTLKECGENGSLYKRIFTKLNDSKKVQIALNPLIKAVQFKEYAILPEYISYLDTETNLRRYMPLIRTILMEAYAVSCAHLYTTSYVNNPIKIYYPIFFEQDYKYELSYLDTNIFDIFLSLFPEVKNALEKMKPKELIHLKNSQRFIRFKGFYIEFIEQLKNKLLKFEIKKYFLDEYEIHDEKYKKNVKNVIEDHPSILYHALDDNIKNKKILSTSRYLRYQDFPIVGFISEVMENIIGSYEEYLYRFYKAKKISESPNYSETDQTPKKQRSQAQVKYENIKIGIVTALPKECAAVSMVLDNVRQCAFKGNGTGHNFYIGEIISAYGGMHTVALGLCRPGNNFAAIRVVTMLEHFPGIESIIMVGIAGGIPFPDDISKHVRLGDIVVSKGIIQYDFVKETEDAVICRSEPAKPSAKLLDALDEIAIKEYNNIYEWKSNIKKYAVDKFAKPCCDDILYNSDGSIIPHPYDDSRDEYPKVFQGKIASANILLKNRERRKKLSREFGVMAIEMEASGIADATWERETGYLVVRGISDYCDEYKNDVWQEYAAMVAACYAKDLISNLPSSPSQIQP